MNDCSPPSLRGQVNSSLSADSINFLLQAFATAGLDASMIVRPGFAVDSVQFSVTVSLDTTVRPLNTG